MPEERVRGSFPLSLAVVIGTGLAGISGSGCGPGEWPDETAGLLDSLDVTVLEASGLLEGVEGIESLSGETEDIQADDLSGIFGGWVPFDFSGPGSAGDHETDPGQPAGGSDPADDEPPPSDDPAPPPEDSETAPDSDDEPSPPVETEPLVQLLLSPDRLELGADKLQEVISVRLSEAVSRAYTATTTEPWLTVTPPDGSCGNEPVELTVSADTTGLPPGEHEAEVQVWAEPDLSGAVTVVLVVPAEPPPAGPHTISGRILALGAGLPGIIVSTSDGVSTLTDEAGLFQFEVPDGWSGTITPRDVNYAFEPATQDFTNVSADVAGSDFAAGRLAPAVPMIGVRRASDGRLLRYQGTQPEGTIGPDFSYEVVFDDDNVTAKLTWLGEDHWELVLTPKVALTEVWFPFELYEYALNGDSADDVFLTTRLFGDAWLSDALDGSFHGPLYPGAAFSPLVVFTDGLSAKMLAAANWPPRAVQPMYARGRMGLLYRNGGEDGYNEVPDVGETFTYGLLQVQASGEPAVGAYAWQRVADRYKQWFENAGTAAGLLPVNYSPWLEQVHGWMTVQLYQLTDEVFQGGYLDYYWDNWKNLFPWMQMWGQTSDYDPVSGCCLTGPEVHPRYLPGLDAFAARVAADGGHVGYYSRVVEPYPPLDGSSPEGDVHLDNLLEWLDVNAAHGANAWYIDILGTQYFGDGLTLAGYFGTLFPADTAIEYAVDLYPAVFYLANCIYGGGIPGAGPGYTDRLDAFGGEVTRVTFPRFGRYLLEDRIIFIGSGNGGSNFWGPEHDHWQERQIFLLGAKIDVHCGLVEQVPYSGELNEALGWILSERDRVGWWSRYPRYRDRSGVYDVPPGIEVRRFVDDAGRTLFVIDNWNVQEGLSFGYAGQEVPVPAQPLAIVEWP